MAKPEEPTITVGHLKHQLESYPENCRLTFSGLRFYRLKQRAPDLVQVEFDQAVRLDDAGHVVVESR
jgi:hypothetical protein